MLSILRKCAFNCILKKSTKCSAYLRNAAINEIKDISRKLNVAVEQQVVVLRICGLYRAKWRTLWGEHLRTPPGM